MWNKWTAIGKAEKKIIRIGNFISVIGLSNLISLAFDLNYINVEQRRKELDQRCRLLSQRKQEVKGRKRGLSRNDQNE